MFSTAFFFFQQKGHIFSQTNETPAALAGRSALCEYWSENPWVAKRKGINLFSRSLKCFGFYIVFNYVTLFIDFRAYLYIY